MESEVAVDHQTSKPLFIAERASHNAFFEDRNWTLVDQIWKYCITLSHDDLPLPLRGDEQYGITNLKAIADCGKAEFESKHDKFKRTTLAFCIGYVGSAYSGYQQQRGQDVLTVEDDLEMAVQRKSVAAGRTDKGVSALSQITSYNTFDAVNVEEVLAAARASAPCQAGRLVIFQCVRVPRKFHPLFGAVWRRYVYLLPLLHTAADPDRCYDVNVDFINQAFSKVIGVELSYNGFAHRENRARDQTDNCTMFRAQASVMHCTFLPSYSGQDNAAVLAIELVANRFLRQMVRILVATVIRESTLPNEERNVNILIDICQSKVRAKAAYAAPSSGLGLCGVGYDLDDLRDFQSKNKRKAEDTSDSSAHNKQGEQQVADTSDNIPPRRKPFNRGHGNNSNSKHNTQNGSLFPASIGFKNRASMIWPNDVIVNTVNYWHAFHSELTCLNSDLLFYPERAFAFKKCGEIILPQSLTGVGTTIWDAEVLLAHHLDLTLPLLCTPNTVSAMTIDSFNLSIRPLKVLELGGGLGLAALVLAKLGHHAWLQELPQVIAEIPQEAYQPLGITFLPAEWGDKMIALLDSSHLDHKFELVIAADVFYHEDHFSVLQQTILHSLKPGGNVVFAFEQRRRDLSSVIAGYHPLFDSCHAHRFSISDGELNAKKDESSVTEYYLCHFNGLNRKTTL